MFCQKCGKLLDDEAVMCPGCGTPTINAGRPAGRKKQAPELSRPLTAEEIEEAKAKKRRTTLYICLAVIGVIVLNWAYQFIQYIL